MQDRMRKRIRADLCPKGISNSVSKLGFAVSQRNTKNRTLVFIITADLNFLPDSVDSTETQYTFYKKPRLAQFLSA